MTKQVQAKSHDLIDNGDGSWGSVLDPETPPVAGAILVDDFNSGSLSPPQGLAKWNSGTRTSIQAGRGKSGSHALQFAYQAAPDPASDSFAEQRFDLGALYDELTIKFDLYYPNGNEPWGGAAFVNRQVSPDNNKFFRLWAVEYSDLSTCGASTFSKSGGATANINTEWNAGDGGGNSENNAGGTANPRAVDFLVPADMGQWLAIKVYVKAPKSGAPGIIRIYKNGTLWKETTTITHHPSMPTGYRYGYLLGWANTGYAAETLIQVDDVAIYQGSVA